MHVAERLAHRRDLSVVEVGELAGRGECPFVEDGRVDVRVLLACSFRRDAPVTPGVAIGLGVKEVQRQELGLGIAALAESFLDRPGRALVQLPPPFERQLAVRGVAHEPVTEAGLVVAFELDELTEARATCSH